MRRSALLSVLVLTACAGRPTPRPGGDDAGEGGPAKGLPPPGTPISAGLEQFAGRATLPADPAEERLRQALSRSLTPPPALDCLAREYAARFGADGRDPDPGTVQHLAEHCGYWTRPVRPYSVTAPDLDKLEDHLRKLPPAALDGVIGLGVAHHADGKVTASLLADPGDVRLEPVPRGDGPVQLSGRILRGDGQIELWLLDNEGPRRLPLTVDPTGTFATGLPAAEAGPRTLELARKRGRFRQTIAVLPLGPPTPAPTASPLENAAPDVLAEKLAAAINARRSARGLPPLQYEARIRPALEDWLQRVADRQANDTPPGMLDERGWPYARLRYALTAGADPAQAVDLLVATPTGTRAVLTDGVDRIAVGARPFSTGRGLDAVVVALQHFALDPPEVVRAAVMKRLAEARAHDHLAPLAGSAELDAVAQAAAEAALAGRTPWKQVVPTLMQRIRDERLARGGFAAGAFPAVTPADAPIEQEAHVLAPEMRYIGIGAAGGPLPGNGAPRQLIVYIVVESLPGDG